MSEHDEDWTDAERTRLAALARQESPPAALEARVVEALRGRGLLRPPARRSWTLAAVAALAGVAVGTLAGRATVGDRGREPAPGRRSFALLLYPGAALDESAGAEQARVEEYRAWARGLAETGQLVSGEKLKPSVLVLRAPAAAAQAASPDAGLQGFFLLRAGTVSEAEAIARTCPHLRHGGTIALREIDPT